MSEESLPEAVESVRQLYSENLRTKGVGPASVGWRDEGTQLLRFQKLAHVIAPSGEALNYNDVGCGYGAMFPFLRDCGAPLEAYFGYDVSEEMLDAARTFIADPRADLIKADHPTRKADYSFVSGTFNVRFASSDDEWTSYILGMLDKMAAQSRRGFAFNLLTKYVDWREPHLYYGDPYFFADHCIRKYSRRVALLHDYPLYEWTITVAL
jgi:SAM-dependent methyltransferase